MTAKIDTSGVPEFKRTRQMRVDEFIKNVQALHEKAGKLFATLKGTAADTETQMALGHIEELEARVSENLRAYRENAPEEILET